MRRLLLLIALIFVFLQDAQTQSIYSSQQDATWEFRFSTSRKANQYTNQVLKQLALAHLKIPEKTSFNFFFSYGTSIGFQQGNQLDISFALTPSVCTGDVVVREFNLQKLLVPASCNLRLSVVNPFKGEVFSSNHENINVADLLAGYTLTSFPDSLWVAGSRVEVEFRGFGFDEAGYKRIEKELYAIRDYDAAASLADTLEKKIRLARIRKVTPEEAFRVYIFCNKAVFLLKEALKKTTEIVPGNDPRGLFAKIPVVVFRFNDLAEYLIKEGISGPVAGNAYTNQSAAFGKALSDAMKLSQRVDYYSSPFYYRLFSNSTTAGQVSQASGILNQFAKERGIKVLDQKLLSQRIVDEYLRKGKILMADGRYAEAVDLLTSGGRFCHVNPAIPMQQRLETALAQARSGLVGSYIRIVQKALDNNVPSLADKYLTEAMLYAGRYGMTDADSSGFAGLYGLLSGKNLQSGNNHLDNRNYQAALTEFDKTINIATQFKLVQVLKQAENGQASAVHGFYKDMFDKAAKALKAGSPALADLLLKEAMLFAYAYPGYKPDPVSIDSLNTGIARINYNSLLNLAEESSKGFNIDKAVELLLQASELSRKYPVIQVPFYDSIVLKAGIPRINALFSKGRLKLWAGEPDKALDLAREALQLASAFGISGKPEIKQQYSSIIEIADETLCNRVRGELTSLINNAGELFSQNKFAEASTFVMKARELIYSKVACGLNTHELNKITEQYKHPLRWNEMVDNAKSLIAAGSYFEGVEMIQQAVALFSYYRLDSLGLANTGLFEIAVTADFLPLLIHATGFYTTRRNYEKSLLLLDRMRQVGAGVTESYELQESLARGLAQRDVAETDMLNLKTMLKVYTGGDKWYKRFSEVYKYHVENP